jgi:putative aldouronate transport system substrate-binding protein
MKKGMRRSMAIALVAAGTALLGWADSGKRMTISVANYQMEPTPENSEMLAYYGNRFGADFKVVNIDHQRYHELLNIKLAAGEIPDLVYLKEASTLTTYVKQGVLAKIPIDALKKNAPDLYKALQTYAPEYLGMGMVNGSLYGIPAVNPMNIFHVPLVYRADWMKKVGVAKTPETLAEFESLMYKFANNDPDGNGKKDTYGLSKDGLMAVFGAFGLVPFDEKTDYWLLEGGRVKNATVTPEAKQALALIAKWYKDGVLDPEFITGENQGGYNKLSHAFIKGRIGFSCRGNYYHWTTAGAYSLIDENGTRQPAPAFANGLEITNANPDARIVFGNPLKGPAGKKGIKRYNQLMNFFCIGKLAEKDPAKMAKILQVLNESASPDFTTRYSMEYGTKDKYWRLLDADSETAQFIPPYDKDISYWSRIGCELWMTVPLPMKQPREQWAYKLGFDKYGINSLIQVGLPKMMKLDSELKKIRDEAYISIITGDKPVGYFDEFVKKYMAAGGTDVEAEVNEYYASHK